jgi:hypothetical protein
MAAANKSCTMKCFHRAGPGSAEVGFGSSRLCVTLVVGLFFAFLGQIKSNTINAANPSLAAVTAAVASAVNGDTVVIPPGTAHWTAGLSITKAIALIGATTVDPVARTADDQTIIFDDIVTDWTPAISISPPAGKTVRVSGITFKPGNRTAMLQGGIVAIGGGQGSARGRLDHCHFFGMYRGSCVYAGTSYGLIDHNLFDFDTTSPFTQSIHIIMGDWNNDTNGIGDKSWSDYPWFGTHKFLFIEDNGFRNTSPYPIMGCIDGDSGARWVIRHNHLYDIQVQTHGTENRVRGARATEVYNNDFHFLHAAAGLGGLRTGSHLIHDNTIDGVRPDNWLQMNNLRLLNRFNLQGPGTSPSGFSGGSGNNGWDINDVTNGTVTPGQTLTTSVTSPIAFTNGSFTYTGVSNGLYERGTCTSGTSNTSVIDTSKNWAPNQWVGFTIRRISDQLITKIQSNTSNTLTVYHSSSGSFTTPDWTSGDGYEIRRTLITIDQPGRGKCDAITGGWNQGGETINSTTGTIAWTHQAQEPIYNWNNIYNGTESLNVTAFGVSDPANRIFVAGRDYFNTANGASHAAVVAKYVAALNGVNYVGPYTYPHPLQSGSAAPSAPTNLRVH